MVSFARARRLMVDGQIRTSDVTDPAVLAAMLDVPRERFVPADKADIAYLDLDLPVGEAGRDCARRLLRPMVLAKLLQAARVEVGCHVLDVGCATGYSAAVLARMGASVVALEEDPGLAAMARETLGQLGFDAVTVVGGPLTAGWPARSPYDVILLDGGTEVVPRSLFSQLQEGGRLVCVERRGAVGQGMVYLCADGVVSGRPVFDAVAPLLPGFAEPPAFVF